MTAGPTPETQLGLRGVCSSLTHPWMQSFSTHLWVTHSVQSPSLYGTWTVGGGGTPDSRRSRGSFVGGSYDGAGRQHAGCLGWEPRLEAADTEVRLADSQGAGKCTRARGLGQTSKAGVGPSGAEGGRGTTAGSKPCSLAPRGREPRQARFKVQVHRLRATMSFTRQPLGASVSLTVLSQ